ncbi:MAG: hypothetical protein HOG58_02760 [Euryarchaeota archaeon]|jgi:hypothetical protein|nr:hypothetical protein [Euryarchaeota archaeon]MBT5638787.1 hypothetical protein [Euryarchaeota archaeon]MBT6072829.1 hypothetical protein [Euryarchaeota archaeon]MBT6075527.1 hypothetical protein [Euryarchaeota archaeon]MBT6560125.1 hypothetical protein [Euryarchaeota archaeon]
MSRLSFERILENNLVKSFIFYSIFRAFYGAGILLFTWLFISKTDYPLWVSLIFLVLSMIFSRVLLKLIKRMKNSDNQEK